MKEQRPPEVDRDGTIAEILARNKANFDQWQSPLNGFQTLAIPEDIADIFVPQRILELSAHPQNVHAHLLKASLQWLDVLIFETLDAPLSTPAAFDAWCQKIKKKQVKVLPQNQEEVPEGLDYKHAAHYPLINQGVLTLSEKVYLEYVARLTEAFPDVVATVIYKDRVELQHQGIGSSFYERLEYVLRELGFTFLGGEIISQHYGFFEKDRIRYSKLDERTKQQLPPEFKRRVEDGDNTIEYMIKRL